MRILTVGIPLPNREIDNHTFANAPTFFDYDVLIVNPAAVSQMIDEVVRGTGEHRTPDDETVYDGPSVVGAAGLGDLINHRRQETQRLLDAGGIVVCFAYPNVSHPSVSRFPGCEMYSWLPSPAGVDWTRDALLPGFGTEVLVTDFEHSFAAFLDRFRSSLTYRAYLADGVGGHVFAMSAGGAPIGVEVQVGPGRLIFVPSLRDLAGGVDRMTLADTIVEACRRAAGDAVRLDEPAWVDTISVPGLKTELAGLADSELVLEAASAQVAEFERRAEALSHYRRLLWQQGRLGLLPVVREALERIGFTVSSAENEDLVIRDGDRTAYVEVEGSVESIDMSPHYRLRKRWEEELARNGRSLRGIVVVNGYRDHAPENRPIQFIDALRIAAESMRYCVVTTTDLFQALQMALEESDPDTLKRFRQSLLETDGIFSISELSPVEQSSEPEEAPQPTFAGDDLPSAGE